MIVIGGGIAGLAAAYRLVHAGVMVTLFERDDRLGGKILTERADGFVVEAGPDAFLSWKPRGKALCDQLGVETVGSNESAKRAFIARAGRLHPLPDGIAGVIPRRFMPTLRSPILSLRGKLRLLVEWAIPRRVDESEESLAHFVRRRAGRQTWERIVEPLVTGVYAGDGTKLAVAATFPMLVDAERDHGGLIRAGLAARKAGRHPPAGPMFLTTADGLGKIVTALTDALATGADLRTGTEITALERTDSGWSVRDVFGDTTAADAVVLATPASVSAKLTRSLDGALTRELAAVQSVSVATVSVAYAQDAVSAPIDGHGYVNPRIEGSPIVACSITSTKFPVRARDGSVLIRAHVGRVGEADPCPLSDDELVALVHGELTTTLGVTQPPTMSRVYRWPEAIPQYDVGHRERVALIRARIARLPGLAVAGATYRGVGIPDCISSGDEAAEAILSHLAATATPA